MINEITIANIATYDKQPQILSGLSTINFLFGSNGTGKTTISRVIENPEHYADCEIIWKNETKLQPMVYNRDFVDRNISQPAYLKGVFTLGEQHTDTNEKIHDANIQLDKLSDEIARLKQTLSGTDENSGKLGELAELEEKIKARCWSLKQKHDEKLKGAFEGYRGSAEKFKSKVLHELATNKSETIKLKDLEAKAERVFGDRHTTEQDIPPIDTTNVKKHESNPILKKRVIGKEDVDIAAMIDKLGNSDWVRKGKSYYDVNNRLCPFCQQSTNESFASSLVEYFDETFESDTNEIDSLLRNYETDTTYLLDQIKAIIDLPSQYLNVEKVTSEKQILESSVTINSQRLMEKKKEPSSIVELDSISNTSESIQHEVTLANEHIKKHNDLVSNISNERIALTSQIWKFVLSELSSDIKSYQASKGNLEKAISALQDKIKEREDCKRRKEIEIQSLERQVTSVQPTIDAINSILNTFGFRHFSLKRAASDTSYELVRPDGSNAQATLSEGESSFVAFLYFYHLLKGSESSSGVTSDRIVVFDDPVSSLDSDILFIVSTLIKDLFSEVRAGSGNIKQVFVLTHNVYFHKEVTFSSKRNEEALRDETFWLVRKPDLITVIEQCMSNPIKTSYELLWLEVRNSKPLTVTIQNTLRRILESYFKILGGIDPDIIIGKFSGSEKMICKSLFSWVNAGSHSAHDDLYVAISGLSAESYLKVFRAIFDKTGHLAHYAMMMEEPYETLDREN